MRFLRLLLLLALSLLAVNCASHSGRSAKYYRVRVTDPRGVLVADWIAEGRVVRNETRTGYRFQAVERLAGGRFPQIVRYPHGRVVEASGPNIVIARCGQPYWLYELTSDREVQSAKAL